MTNGLVVEGEVAEALRTLAAKGLRADLVVADPPWGMGDLVVDGLVVEADDPDGNVIWMDFAATWLRGLLPLLKPQAIVAVLIDGPMVNSLSDLMQRTLDRQAITTITWEREYIVDGKRGVDTPVLLVAEHEGTGSPEHWRAEECGTALASDLGAGRYRTAGILEVEGLIGRHRSWAAKPAALYRKIIERWSRPTGVVLDPFAGTGPAAQAAAELGRHWILIERPKEVGVLVKRLNALGLNYDRA